MARELSVSIGTLHRWVCDARNLEEVDRSLPLVATEQNPTLEGALEDALGRIARLEARLAALEARMTRSDARGSVGGPPNPVARHSTASH